jgi:hypothetical protein
MSDLPQLHRRCLHLRNRIFWWRQQKRIGAGVLKSGRVGSVRDGLWLVLAGRVNGFSRDRLGRIHFGGLAATHSRPVRSNGLAGRVQGGTDRRVHFFSKILKNSKILKIFEKLKNNY